SPDVRAMCSISTVAACIIASSESLLETFETHLLQRGHDGPDDDGRLSIRQVLHAPRRRALAALRCDFQDSRVVRRTHAGDAGIAILAPRVVGGIQALDDDLAVDGLDRAQLP